MRNRMRSLIPHDTNSYQLRFGQALAGNDADRYWVLIVISASTDLHGLPWPIAMGRLTRPNEGIAMSLLHRSLY